MPLRTMLYMTVAVGVLIGSVSLGGCDDENGIVEPGSSPPPVGQEIFRYETFGDEQVWTDVLRMHEVIQSAVDPNTALSVGLKVDADALPPGILASADLSDPATTVALIGLDAVVGIRGEVDEQGNLTRVGVSCALCHTTVDDSVAPGIGRRLDGWANRDLNPGAILALSPALQDPQTQAALNSWGPGRYDARWNQDGISEPVLIPPIYGLKGVALETYTGDGPVSYWNSYVAVTQMGGQGNFVDPRIGVDVAQSPDLVTPKLADLLEYQLSLEPPVAPAGSFDAAAAQRGKVVFEGQGRCADCHMGSAFTDASFRLHAAEETGMEPVAAERSATGQYRTTPLRALWNHAPYFHDGSAETLDDVVRHYDTTLNLGLDEEQIADLVDFLKSI